MISCACVVITSQFARLRLKITSNVENMNQAQMCDFITGEWNGFYIEKHHENRGWMHLYLEFDENQIKGEGTDYVGPWVLRGSYDSDSSECEWVKQYMGRHKVTYRGKLTSNGIVGEWVIAGLLRGPFHIWPKRMTHLNEMYMTEDLERQQRNAGENPSMLMDKEGPDNSNPFV